MYSCHPFSGLDMKSRMKREFHVRFCEKPRVAGLPGALGLLGPSWFLLAGTGLAMTGFGFFFVFRNRSTVVAEIHRPARHKGIEKPAKKHPVRRHVPILSGFRYMSPKGKR